MEGPNPQRLKTKPPLKRSGRPRERLLPRKPSGRHSGPGNRKYGVTGRTSRSELDIQRVEQAQTPGAIPYFAFFLAPFLLAAFLRRAATPLDAIAFRCSSSIAANPLRPFTFPPFLPMAARYSEMPDFLVATPLIVSRLLTYEVRAFRPFRVLKASILRCYNKRLMVRRDQGSRCA